MSLRSPLGRVLGYGSAKDGTGHWWAQRVTAIALVVLGGWFMISLMQLPDFAYGSVIDWVGRPWSAIMLLLLAVTLAYHSNLGLQVVIEDYVHGHFLKVMSLILSNFVHVAIAVAAVFAVLKIAFGAAP